MNNKYDFPALAADLLSNSEGVCSQWLPAGKRRGHEYVCGNLNGDAGESLSINLNTGVWADFSSGDAGGDLISLYAAINHVDQGEAFKQLSNGHAPVAITNKKPAKPGPSRVSGS